MEINIVGAFIDEIGIELNNISNIVGPENVTVDQIYSTPDLVNPEYWHDQILMELNGNQARTVLETVASTKYHGSNIPGETFVKTMLMELQDCDPKIWGQIISSVYLSKIYTDTVGV